jgi:chloramphenicol O-acetyltransferase type A
MYKEIKIATWKRKALFEFFKDFDDPFFNITANLDVTPLHQFCKKNKLSFFLSNLHCALETVHEIPEFKLRLLDGKLVEYEEISIGSTILHDDETFSFCYFKRGDDIFSFNKIGKENIEKQKASKKLNPGLDELNNIHCSIIPWVAFTSFKHAKNFGNADTIPKIVFGKLFDETGRKKMPLSVEVNHAMMDGLHVGKYFEKLQKRIDGLN